MSITGGAGAGPDPRALGAPASALTVAQAAAVLMAVHDAEGVDLGSRSTREDRGRFITRVAGILYWGHPVYNSTPDRRWCVKDAGGGRPIADDVLAWCGSRDAWDVVIGAGGSSYAFPQEYLGLLPWTHNVHIPPVPDPAGLTAARRYGLPLLTVPVGGVQTVTGHVADGTYFMRVMADVNGRVSQSNQVRIDVGQFALPAAPLAVTAAVAGNAVVFAWQPPASNGGLPIDRHVFEAGSGPGLSDIAVAAVGDVLSVSVPAAPNGGYYVRVRAVTIAGAGAASADARVVVSVGGVTPGGYFIRIAARSAGGLGDLSNELALVVP